MNSVSTHPSDLLDTYLRVCSNESLFVRQYESLIERFGIVGPTLDCAVGTGFGTIPLLKQGRRIVCSDGSRPMLERFSEYADREEVAIKPHHINWTDLGSYFPSVFELVMCRGNSLAYADSWDNEDTRASNHDLMAHLDGMYRSIADGGYLFVDIPVGDPAASGSSSTELRHSGRTTCGQLVLIDETIATDFAGQRRSWSVRAKIGDEEYRFSRYSILFDPADFLSMLGSVGFTSVSEHGDTAVRAHYRGYVAQK